ncbi:MAG: hypothetical protein RMM58_13720 [Chloroflexota bacterium]|nr:hypothetical protein [Dehalococcoidia bacterium]MDW8254929.1 hypothetical protein [Chloroflexota bacterium]
MGCLTVPFRVAWRLLTALLGIVGRLLLGLTGIVLIVIGVMLSLSVAGAVAGVPLIVLGAAFVLRALL